MMQILFGSLTGISLFLIISDCLRIPYIKTSKAVRNLSKSQKRKISSIDFYFRDLATWASKKIRINEYKRMQLLSDLQTANLDITPEIHIANALIKSCLCGLLVIPTLIIFPLISPLAIAFAFVIYFKEYKGVQEKIKIRRSAIEFELPRLVFTIEKTLAHSRDVLEIFDVYREDAGIELKHELSITVADMRSGNYESALTRLESRVGSAMLSDVTRGLISVLRGDNTSAYWISLSLKFSDIQRQRLKGEAQKVPSKVRRLSIVLLFCFISTYLIVIISQIMISLGAIFG